MGRQQTHVIAMKSARPRSRAGTKLVSPTSFAYGSTDLADVSEFRNGPGRWIKTAPFSFLVAVIFDQTWKADRTWRVPELLKERLGYEVARKPLVRCDRLQARGERS